MLTTEKPRLIFFRSSQEGLPFFIQLHLKEQVRCLSLFFDVIVIHKDCDYSEICGRHEPDLCLFESGVYERVPRRKIHNASSRPDIPKLGFCHADAYCVTREVFLADMWTWGVESFFTSSAVMHEYMPDIAKNLFVWPNFADGELYRDYGESKLIPVLFTGSRAAHYPWRNRVDAEISQYYASFKSPHFGWFDASKTGRMVYGESYARLLNASWAVPACGTIAREAVRKHFEIPAAKACLLTERTNALESAGFVDMYNCVFTDAAEVVDKLDYLFEHRDKFYELTQNGYDLVHGRHLLAHRNEIYQWYVLNKSRKPWERIVQSEPFQSLALVPNESSYSHTTKPLSGVDRILIRDGDTYCTRGEYKKAEELYMRCLAYHYIPEASLRMVICKLLEGDVKAALYWLDRELLATVTKYGSTPDPVVWAYVLIAYVCGGQLNTAMALMNKYPSLRHHELTMAKQVIFALIGQGNQEAARDSNHGLVHYSIHRLPDQSFLAWMKKLDMMLRACNQMEFAQRLSGKATMAERMPIVSKGRLPYSYPDSAQRVTATASTFKRLYRVNDKIIGKFWGGLRQIEKHTKDFLPYRYSSRRRSKFCRVFESILKEEDFKSIMVYGAVTGRIATDVCFAVCSEKIPAPTLFCLHSKTAHGKHLHRYFITGYPTNRERALAGSHSVSCDVAVVDGGEWDDEEALNLLEVKLIIIYDLLHKVSNSLYESLRANADYRLVASDLETGRGFAVYKRNIGNTRNMTSMIAKLYN